MPKQSQAKSTRTARLQVPDGIPSKSVSELSGVLNTLLADIYALYFKTKNHELD